MLKLLALLGAVATVYGSDSVVSGNMVFAGRVDPIAGPGQVSQHVHSVFGASNFRDVLNTPDEQLKATCTTMKSTADKSNYWIPSLYWIDYDEEGNRSYSLMTVGVRAYYHHYTTPDTKPKTEAFPPGFRQVVGDAMNRANDQHVQWFLQKEFSRESATEGKRGRSIPSSGCSKNSPAPDCAAFSDVDDPTHLVVPLDLLQCGNGALDSPDHKSHVSYTIDEQTHEVGPGNGMQIECPPTHPHLYPRIGFDILYNIKNGSADDPYTRKWRPNVQNVVLSNGDVTGRTMHADFYMGWDRGVLQKVLDDCYKGAEDDWQQHCPHLGETLAKKEDGYCLYAGQVPEEEIGLVRPIKELPGGVQFWDHDGPDVMPKPNPKPTKFVSPNAMYIGAMGQPLPVWLPDYTNATGMIVAMNDQQGQVLKPWADTGTKYNESVLFTSVEDMVKGNIQREDHIKVFGMSDTSAYSDMGKSSV